jgi:elongator complex protein 1
MSFSADAQIALHKRDDLTESYVWPGMDDAQEGLIEVFEEMDGQLDKEVARLEALTEIRLEDPGQLLFP